MNRVQITPLEVSLIIITFPMVVVFSNYPHLVLSVTTKGWWEAIVVEGIAMALILWGYLTILDAYPRETFVGVARRQYRAILGVIIILPWLLDILLTTYVSTYTASGATVVELMPQMPTGMAFLFIILTSAFIASLGVAGIARYGEIIILLVSGPLIGGIIIMAWTNAHGVNVQPWLWWPPRGLFSATGVSRAGQFLGMLPVLGVLGPYMAVSRVRRWAPWIALTSAFVLIFSMAGMIGALGSKATETIPYPFVFFLNASPITILFVQEIGQLAEALWLLLVFAVIAALLWAWARSIGELLGHAHHNRWIWLTALILIALSRINPSIPVQKDIMTIWTESQLWVSVWYLVVLGIPAWWAGRQRVGGPHAS